jgi:hypothetical protein
MIATALFANLCAMRLSTSRIAAPVCPQPSRRVSQERCGMCAAPMASNRLSTERRRCYGRMRSDACVVGGGHRTEARATDHARLAYPHVSNRIARHWRGYARGSVVENPLVHRRAESNTSTRTIPRSGESPRIPVVHKRSRRRSEHRGISSAHNTTATAAVDNSASIAPPTRGLHASNAAALPQRLAAITAR